MSEFLGMKVESCLFIFNLEKLVLLLLVTSPYWFNLISIFLLLRSEVFNYIYRLLLSLLFCNLFLWGESFLSCYYYLFWIPFWSQWACSSRSLASYLNSFRFIWGVYFLSRLILRLVSLSRICPPYLTMFYLSSKDK